MTADDRYDLQGVQVWPTMFFTRRWCDFAADGPDIIAFLEDLTSRQRQPVDSGVAVESKPGRGISESGFDLLAEPHEKLTKLRCFVESTVAVAAGVANGLEVPPEEMVVTIVDSWCHVTNDGGFHDAHHHHGCSWCGIVYLRIGDSGLREHGGAPNGGSRFYSPLLRGGAYRDYGNRYLTESLDVPLEDGMVLLFPSYLLHAGLPYRGAVDRVLIAFNARVHLREGSSAAARFTRGG